MGPLEVLVLTKQRTTLQTWNDFCINIPEKSLNITSDLVKDDF